MPKTANKRAQARRTTRVQQAHRSPIERPASRRVPLVQRAARPRGVRGFVRTYPFATTIFVLLLVGMGVLIVHNQQLGPWAPPPKPVQARCDLTTHTCNKAPLMTINKNHYFTATIQTARGNIVLELDSQSAPIAVNNFVFLARQGFYDGLTFNRVERPGQVSPVTHQINSNLNLIQGGAGGKNGGPGYSLTFDNNTDAYTAGSVAMANESQFFINTADNSQAITGTKYTVFAHVLTGLDVAQKIQPDDKIIRITIQEQNVAPTPTPSPTASATATVTASPTATPKK